MISHDLTWSHDQTARRDMLQNPKKDARKLRFFQLPFPRINEGSSIWYTATHNKLPAAKQIKAAAPAPSKLLARKVPSPMPNGVIKERRINNVHQALTDTVSSSKDPAEKAANSLCAMTAIKTSENSDISSAAPVAVPAMKECRHRPTRADIPAVRDFPGRTARGCSSAFDSFSEPESSITWASDSFSSKKTSTERMVRKPIPSRTYPNGNASADLFPLKKTAMATPGSSIWSLASASIWTKVTAKRIPPARALETRTIFGEKFATHFDKAAPLNATMNKAPADTAFTVVSRVDSIPLHYTSNLILLNQNLHRHMQFYAYNHRGLYHMTWRNQKLEQVASPNIKAEGENNMKKTHNQARSQRIGISHTRVKPWLENSPFFMGYIYIYGKFKNKNYSRKFN